MNLFETFVILISLSGYLGFFTNVQKNPLKALFPLNGLIILTLYLFGVNQKLDFGYYFLILFGILLFTFNCKFLIKFYYEKKNWCMYIIYAIPFFLLVIIL